MPGFCDQTTELVLSVFAGYDRLWNGGMRPRAGLIGVVPIRGEFQPTRRAPSMRPPPPVWGRGAGPPLSSGRAHPPAQEGAGVAIGHGHLSRCALGECFHVNGAKPSN